MKTNNTLEQLEKMRQEGAKFVYVKRHGIDGVVIDLPIGSAPETLRRHPKWEIVSSEKSMRAEVEALFNDDLPEPVKEGATWEHKCEVCGKVAKNANGLRLHKNVHKA